MLWFCWSRQWRAFLRWNWGLVSMVVETRSEFHDYISVRQWVLDIGVNSAVVYGQDVLREYILWDKRDENTEMSTCTYHLRQDELVETPSTQSLVPAWSSMVSSALKYFGPGIGLRMGLKLGLRICLSTWCLIFCENFFHWGLSHLSFPIFSLHFSSCS